MSDEIFARLAAPFPPGRISWRVGATNKRKWESAPNNDKPPKRGTALAYIDARDVMDRLDEVVGAGAWQDRYPHAGQKTVCEIGIRIDGEWIWKSDGAGDTDVEASKGALSDAFKRAGVRWGIGRYLYTLPARWIPLDDRWSIPASEYSRLQEDLRRVGQNVAMPEPEVGDVAAMNSAQSKRDGRWDDVVAAFRNSATADMLKEAAEVAYADVIAAWPDAWKDEARAIYEECKVALRAKQAA